MPRAQAAEADRLADIGARVGNANRDARRDEARPVGKVPYYTGKVPYYTALSCKPPYRSAQNKRR